MKTLSRVEARCAPHALQPLPRGEHSKTRPDLVATLFPVCDSSRTVSSNKTHREPFLPGSADLCSLSFPVYLSVCATRKTRSMVERTSDECLLLLFRGAAGRRCC